MGLDLVEFTIAIEDAFGIFIPDEDAEGLATPGQLVAYLEGRLQGGTSACLEQRAFYELRKAGMQVLDRPREAFRPSTLWADVLHPTHLPRQWDLIRRAAGLSPWPPLKPLLSFGTPSQTMGDTAKFLATTAPRALMIEGEGWSRAAIESVVRGLMAEELGVTQFQLTDRFVQDLGCN
jgi:hypothetical protein